MDRRMKGCVESKIIVHSASHKALHCGVSRVPLVVWGTRTTAATSVPN